VPDTSNDQEAEGGVVYTLEVDDVVTTQSAPKPVEEDSNGCSQDSP
jgi:hypothetical protein